MTFFVFYITCILSIGVALNVQCENEWIPCPQSGTCVNLFNTPEGFKDADQQCKNYGADLVKILDREMNDFIIDMVKSKKGKKIYIGLQRTGTRNIYKWTQDITEANYVNLTISNTGGSCVTIENIQDNQTPTWVATDCSIPYPYVCEKNSGTGGIDVMCPANWYPNPHAGTCIKVVRNSRSWHKARRHCQYHGGDLAAILDRKSDQFVSDQTVTVGWRLKKSLWIGLNDLDREGTFKWLDNVVDKINYSRDFLHGQPQSNCVKISPSMTSKTPVWDVNDCDENLPFICEKIRDCDYEVYWGQIGMLCPKSCTSALCANDPAACNRRNGVCQKTCTNGTYGNGCLETCSSHCKGPDNRCTFLTASCVYGCEVGYQGDTCKTECSDLTYGEKCLKSCSPNCGGGNKKCHHINGKCLSGCADGYTGSYCDTECSDHTYGEKCLKSCSPHCADGNKICNHINGKCPSGCADGYTGSRCDRVCSARKYGAGCLRTCSPNCGGRKKLCNHVNGTCLSGCADGYTGVYCDTGGKSYSTIAIVAAAVFAGIVLLICILPSSFVRRKTGSDATDDQELGQEGHIEPHMEYLEFVLTDMVPSNLETENEHHLDDESADV